MDSSEASDWENQTSKQEKPERAVSRRRPLKKIFVSDVKENPQVDNKKSVKPDRYLEALQRSGLDLVHFSLSGNFFSRIYLNLDSCSYVWILSNFIVAWDQKSL